MSKVSWVVQQLPMTEILQSSNRKRLLTTPVTTLQCATGLVQQCQCVYMLLLINRPNCTKRYNTQQICQWPFTQEKLSSWQQDMGTTSKAQNGTHFQWHQRVDGQYVPQTEIRKTEYIMFGSCQQLTKINPEPLQAGPDLIELSNKVKYLGTLLDNTPSFDQHISSKVQKAMANFIKVRSICKYITWEACTTLLLMLCMSQLDYLNAVLYGIPNKTLNKYQRIQNMCAKLVLGKSKYDSSTE